LFPIVPVFLPPIRDGIPWRTWRFPEGDHRKIQDWGVRVSVFVDPYQDGQGAAEVGADRVELYTEPYASGYARNREEAIRPYIAAAGCGHDLGLDLNAGHDLSLLNLRYFNEKIPYLNEVSIGHALVCDALYFGFENTIQLYLNQLRQQSYHD
jgi:pyridoxine 5-phosphate synthase